MIYLSKNEDYMQYPITNLGRKRLSDELYDLKMVQRPDTVKEIDIARGHGDLKENAEYHAAREKLRFIEARIAELADIYDNSKVIDPSTLSHSKVMFGSSVTLIDLDSEDEYTYTIVGTYESDPDRGLISMLTPLAKALLGKEEADEVRVELPSGVKEYEIEKIFYKEIVFD
jgi:transcription elongation factor GreA